MNIVSLSPAATEILFALGLEEEVAGVSARCDTPPEVIALPRVTSGAGLRLERILDLEPDLVVIGGDAPPTWAREVRDALAADGIDAEVLALDPISV
ncbi:MAG: ABC transporter substrate-binding protein, partial [Chloroflexota bacterium]